MVKEILNLSATKVWFNIGNLAISFAYLWSILHGGNFESNTTVYAMLVGGTKIADKFMMLKWGNPNMTKENGVSP